jgi:hypothetical protein
LVAPPPPPPPTSATTTMRTPPQPSPTNSHLVSRAALIAKKKPLLSMDERDAKWAKHTS